MIKLTYKFADEVLIRTMLQLRGIDSFTLDADQIQAAILAVCVEEYERRQPPKQGIVKP